MDIKKYGEIALISLITIAIVFHVSAIRGPVTGM